MDCLNAWMICWDTVNYIFHEDSNFISKTFNGVLFFVIRFLLTDIQPPRNKIFLFLFDTHHIVSVT